MSGGPHGDECTLPVPVQLHLPLQCLLAPGTTITGLDMHAAVAKGMHQPIRLAV